MPISNPVLKLFFVGEEKKRSGIIIQVNEKLKRDI